MKQVRGGGVCFGPGARYRRVMKILLSCVAVVAVALIVVGAMGIVLASGAGALGVVLGGPLPSPAGAPDWRPELGTGDPVEPELLPSAVGLVWRALVLWLVVILLVTLANLLP